MLQSSRTTWAATGDAMDNDAESSEGKLGEAGKAAGKVAVAAMLASTLSATPPNEVDFPLPEATPIVYVMHPDGPDAVPDSPVDDEQNDSKAAIWKKILQILKYLLLVLALAAGIAIAVLNGCTSCSGSGAAPVEQSSSSSAAVA